ncbi:efflux RND transporter periplasmic adaptor subunit [Lentisphaerota bacterium ZTH]|nr:efflux RND transporter periplasmic adaptor subunit [Lentisphaerota bacterium]WET05874.1 efflux RND transporter periplasmic adaptor subunit [Lentisphaerota bacterium ZTH]
MKNASRIGVGVLLLAVVLPMFYGCRKGDEQGNRVVKVETTMLKPHNFVKAITVQGCVQSTNTANISARTSGIVDVLNISTGSKVKKGQVMFQIDKANLEKKVSIAQQQLKVVKTELRSAIVDFRIAKLSLAKAKKDDERGRFLCNQKAISTTAYESEHLAFMKAEGELAKAKAVVANKMAEVEQSENNLEMAKKDLKDSEIVAPFNGVVLDKSKSLGEYASSAEYILLLEDLDSLQLVVRLSSIYYNQIIVGKTHAIISVPGMKQSMYLPVTYKDPGIDMNSRTFEVDIEMPKHEKIVRGMLTDADIILSRHVGPGVPESAIMDRANGVKKVFLYENGKAKCVTVETGVTTDGYTEILNPDVLKNRQVVTHGMEFLNEGDAIALQDDAVKPEKKTVQLAGVCN